MRTRRSINRRNWLDLPDEVTANILMKLGPIEILLTAQRVCQSWRKICKEDSSMWRRIELNDSMCNEMKMWRRTFKASYPIWKNSNSFSDSTNLWMMCCQAIERSRDGQLIDIDIDFFGLGAILPYIAKRSSGLKRLRLASCFNISNKGLIQFSPKFPLLEELELTNLNFSKEALEAVGKSCPLLRSFKLNFATPIFRFLNHSPDDQALAIAETMPGLRHLELFGNALTNIGLYAILNGCPHLESLDLRECIHISARYDDLKHQIKSLKLGLLGHVGL
ncbi:hypothetical protein ACFE04_011283 [Oxalis oulophora]